MNTRQLQYAITLAKVRNFSQVADMLNISQPALSKQIINLEGELGLKIFDRSTTPLTLTAAGEHFIRQAEELCYREEQLLRSMDQFRSGEAGRLTIGISPFRCMYMIPHIIKQVRDKFPGVQVVLHETGSDTLRAEAAEGKYDFAIVNLPVDDTVLEITPLEADTLVLAVPNALRRELPEGSEVELSQCRDLPYVVVGQNQELRQLFDHLCAAAQFHPNIAAEVVGLSSAWALAQAGVGAAVLPLQFVSGASFHKDLTLFTIRDSHSVRQPVIVRRKGQYLSPYAAYAIELLTK